METHVSLPDVRHEGSVVALVGRQVTHVARSGQGSRDRDHQVQAALPSLQLLGDPVISLRLQVTDVHLRSTHALALHTLPVMDADPQQLGLIGKGVQTELLVPLGSQGLGADLFVR